LTLIDLALWIKDAGTLAVLLLVIWGWWTGKYIWRWQHDREIETCNARTADYKRDAQEWKTLSLELLRSNRTSVETGKSLADIASTTVKEHPS
jgi:hypothetical protein